MIRADDIQRFFDGFGLGNVANQFMKLVNKKKEDMLENDELKSLLEKPQQSDNQTLTAHNDHNMNHSKPDHTVSPPASNVGAKKRSRGGSSDELAGAKKPHFDEEYIRTVEAELNDILERMCAGYLKIYEDAESEFMNKS